MQFRSRCFCASQLACETVPAAACEVVLVPCFLFQKGVKGSAFANTCFFFLPFLFIFPSFLLVSFDLPTANFSFILRARYSAISLFFNVKKVPLALLFFFFFLTSLPRRLAVLVFTLKCARAHTRVFRSSPLLRF